MKDTFSKRDSNIIKGFAIFIMMYHHLFRLTSFSEGYSVSFAPFSNTRIAQICKFFKICVPLFVFVSGYGLLKSYKKNKNKDTFFFQRYFKLMPTFWIVAILYFIYTEIYNNLFTRTFFTRKIYSGIINLLLNFFGLSGLFKTMNYSENWWYIGASLAFIFFIPILFKGMKKYGILNVGLALIILPRVIGISNFSTKTAFPFIFSLYLGMVCEQTNGIEKIISYSIVKNKSLNKIIKFILYILLLGILYIYSANMGRDVIWELHFAATPFVVILILKEFINCIPIISSLLEHIGKQSYIIFLIHGVIIENYKSFLLNDRHFIISGIILLIISYFIAFIINKILELIHYNHLFKPIEKRLVSSTN